MSTSSFRIQEHVLPGQHIREYPHATLDSQEDALHLAVKQYIPLDNPTPGPGDVTIIGAHANGFPKELYEPLWDEILRMSKVYGFRIRGIWIADVAHQGWSSVINENKLGNDPSWLDHPRDLLHMVNHFRDQMPRPIIGVGHSMGGAHLVQLSLMHPRLLETLVLIDPVFAANPSVKGTFLPAQASSFRRDRWPSRKAAGESFKRSKFYQAWDPRVLDRWVKYGLREIPTKLYPDAQSTPAATGAAVTMEPTVTPNVAANFSEKEVTLTTTKHQEVFTFTRPNFAKLSDSLPVALTHPDLPPDNPSPFYRAEPLIIFNSIPFIRPSVLYIFGEHSEVCRPADIAQKMALTGTGLGGSGGVRAGRVEKIVVQKTGHLIPMEKVEEMGGKVAEWIGRGMRRWAGNERIVEEAWRKVPEQEKFTLGKRTMEEFENMEGGRKPKPRL